MTATACEIVAPRFSDARIIAASERLVSQYIDQVGTNFVIDNGLSFDHFYSTFIYKRWQIELVEDEPLGVDAEGRDILGKYDSENNVAFVSPELAREREDPRRAFTLWHEVAGHGVLQGEWLRRQHRRMVQVTEDSMSPATRNRLERQANLFASHVAAPSWFVRRAVHDAIPGRDTFPYMQPAPYCLMVKGLPVRRFIRSVDHLSWWIALYIKDRFGGLSAAALGYRIKDLGIVTEPGRQWPATAAREFRGPKGSIPD